MKGGIGQLMKQAQQMQADMQKAQEEMANLTVTGESGGGMVKHDDDLQASNSLAGDRRRCYGDDKDMLEDLIVAAFNDAVRRVEQTVQEKFSGMTAGSTCPPA